MPSSGGQTCALDRKSTRLNSSHGSISYAVFCLNKKEIYEELDNGQIPHMKIPLRTKANCRCDAKHAVWKYGKLLGGRSAKKLIFFLMLRRPPNFPLLPRDTLYE